MRIQLAHPYPHQHFANRQKLRADSFFVISFEKYSIVTKQYFNGGSTQRAEASPNYGVYYQTPGIELDGGT